MYQTKILIGSKETNTRIVFPPMATQGSIDGLPSEELMKHYETIAKNPNVGMIIIEHAFVDESGKADPYQLSFSSEEVVSKQREFVKRIKSINPSVVLIAQISHAGANTKKNITKSELVSASEICMSNDKSKSLTKMEIHNIENKFAIASKYAIEAGYDGVEIHGAHGYLLNQFYSPLTNYRDDDYGTQTIENRLRIYVETIRKTRETIGRTPIISVRFGGCDYMEGGSTIADAITGAKLLINEEIDFLDISGGMCSFINPNNRKAGYFSDMSEKIKQFSKIPIMLTGGIKTVQEAEELLLSQKADLIGMGRSLFKNS